MSNQLANWEEYLDQLSQCSLDVVRQMWNQLSREIPQVRIPMAAPSEYNDKFCFAWDDDVSYLCMEFSTGRLREVEWMYINDLTKEVDSSDQPTPYITKELLDIIQLCGTHTYN